MGICATCGETVYRAIPIDEDNHVYGDWQITKMSTETATGTATKKCTLNSDVELFSGTYSTSLSYTPKGTVKVTWASRFRLTRLTTLL